jgi:hypothetical protein
VEYGPGYFPQLLRTQLVLAPSKVTIAKVAYLCLPSNHMRVSTVNVRMADTNLFSRMVYIFFPEAPFYGASILWLRKRFEETCDHAVSWHGLI